MTAAAGRQTAGPAASVEGPDADVVHAGLGTPLYVHYDRDGGPRDILMRRSEVASEEFGDVIDKIGASMD